MESHQEVRCSKQQLFKDMPCQIFVDDILIWGGMEREHDENLKKVMDRAREANLKLNKKCKIKVPSVSYVGHVLTCDSPKPDLMNTKAICEM